MSPRPWTLAQWGDEDLWHALTSEDGVRPGGDPAGLVTTGLRIARQHAATAAALDADPGAYLRLLATLGAVDLTVARAAEPHLDAIATLAQAGLSPADVGAGADSTWGVFAARAPGMVLRATRDAEGTWTVSGRKPWCSLADTVTHALVTAEADDGYRLFALDLRHPGVRVDATAWVPRGLVGITTATLHLDGVPVVPVGGPGWYLERPGFAWGGIGVAAVWFGGAAAVAGQLLHAATRREPDQIALMHLGACDRALTAALAVLQDIGRRIATDPGRADEVGALLALRARSVVADTVDVVLREVGHGSGPAPLAMDADHTARVADLTLYVRQHHGERDLAALGRQLLERPA